ncbi:TetR family transcriptional regulator [Pseudomonas alcaligenes]|uniref:TetR family transcriptional regulator n=1 Tax=Aquipseudomonas alcaligenes TaxID=43263 RepID=A0ABR7RY71_AQUAC|nr:TetR/AcrR family transcriptional regulator [Pseudomonas alcaligenes]MBC9250286.1 TetR family transcriptional regulator [Pseudomonas alcaligenes]
MRYAEDHKAKTRQRIIEEAARLFRQDGVGATGLQPLMKALGLTHGGFYAHFKSKDELVEIALQHATEQLKGSAEESLSSATPVATFISRYLSPAHRANPGAGCPLTTMCAELGQRGQPSELTDQVIRERLSMLESHLPGDTAAEQSVLVLSAMVGALLLSRSVKDPELADRLLQGTRHLLIEQTKAAQ